MAESIFIARAAVRPPLARSTRLDAILASAEEALARAEAKLRQSQQMRMSGIYQQLLDTTVLEAFPQEAVSH